MSTFLLGARQQERDNIHFVMPGSVTRETCMKVTKPPQKKDAEDVHSCTECTFSGTVDEFVDHWYKYHSSGLSYLRCPKCPKTFRKKDFLLLHIKYQHQQKAMRTKKEPEDIKENFEESPNFNLGRSLLERVCHELQRQELPRSETDRPPISDIGSRSAGNRSMQTMPTSSLSAPLLSSQNVPWPQLPILPSQHPVPRSDPPLLVSQVPTPQAVPLQGQVAPFYPATVSVPKPVPPPLRPPPLLTSPPLPQPVPPPAIGSQSFPPAYPQPPVPWFSNTSNTQTSPQAGAALQLPQTGQVITQSVSVQPPEFVMEQPPVASQSVIIPSEDHSSIPELDAQDLNDFDTGNVTTQETSPESESEPEMVTEKKANDELRRSVQSGSVLALSPEWTKTLKIAHPKKSSLEENTSEKKCSFKTQVKFVPKFDRTLPDSIRKFLLWSHIMMERLEDANIKVRRGLKADEGQGDVAEGDDDEDPEEMLDFSSDEETGGGKSTAVKGTLSQADEDMKARAQTVAEKVVADYRSTNRYTKVASNKGQSGKGVGKQRMLDKQVLGQLFHKSIGMIKYLSKRANVDADLVRHGISWVKRDIRKMLEQERTVINGDWSRKEHQQRTDNRDLIRDEHQRWTNNFGWSRDEFPDLQMHDRGQAQFFEDERFSQEEYLDCTDDDRISSSNFADGGTTKPSKKRSKKRKRSRRGNERFSQEEYLDCTDDDRISSSNPVEMVAL
ncbi:titin-like [Haliotis rubra]|uniref:titin-like n=1 Tax=Haliotis rubra TaxID=36100 RepID=UPI001EE575A4|nr:titin-like [Haliotis rubra]